MESGQPSSCFQAFVVGDESFVNRLQLGINVSTCVNAARDAHGHIDYHIDYQRGRKGSYTRCSRVYGIGAFEHI